MAKPKNIKLHALDRNHVTQAGQTLDTETRESEPSGYVHSIESMGTVDGPGIRTVVFLAGCPMKCKYCHNVDVTQTGNGTRMTPEQLAKTVSRNKSYFQASGGGVTFSGGDPVFQAPFLQACLEFCKEEEIHTAVDTSLYTSIENLKKIAINTDLFLVSIKQLNSEDHKTLTGVRNEIILENLAWLSGQNKAIWIRYVLIPGLTDSETYLTKFTQLLKGHHLNIIEVLPFHQTGQDKWALISTPYEFGHVKIPTKSEIKTVIDFFKTAGFDVLCNYN
ncbi:pyruvate formate lyase-activating protein [bacterium]|nr:pyruvate formate lyase-activating protein [bacterium]NCQ55122.1 pyruvate formate lyase-activating protein [Candidatus Parcubacteria bacterium]NCS67365.1 pyruvate formate lyase-activating protein [Candidatus Peregrinibacteria bacterium]NCS96620.1 pyruvate formate lyase-activating protein [bacterium]